MAEAMTGIFARMLGALNETVVSHTKIREGINAHAEKEGERLEGLRAAQHAQNQMTSLTGKVEY